MTIKKQIWLGFGALLVLIGVSAAFNFHQFHRAESLSRELAEISFAELMAAETALSSIESARFHEQRFLALRDPGEATSLAAAIAAAKQGLDALSRLPISEERRQAVTTSTLHAEKYLAGFEHVRQLVAIRGITGTDGLEGEMRAAAENVEAKIKEQGLAELTVLLLMIRQHEKDFLLRGDPEFGVKIKQCIAELDAQMTQFSLPLPLRQEINALWARYQTAFDALVTGEQEISLERERFGQLASALQEKIKEIAADVSAEISAAQIATIRNLAGGKQVLLMFGLGSILIGMISAFWVTRVIVRSLANVTSNLEQSASQVSLAADKIASTSKRLADGANTQAASLEETSASLEEMSSMSKRNSADALSAKTLAGDTRVAADAGAEDMRQMKAAMDEIKLSSGAIANIVKTIDEIAFQTNILALNAAVEAARAGEAGAGFAVVADEVRSLARRSAEAAKETASKIEESLTKSDRGVHISQKVTESLNSILGRVRQVDSLVADIAKASDEQNQGTSEVAKAVAQMDLVTQDTALDAEECANAAQQLNVQADSLEESVAAVLALVKGRKSKSSSKQTALTPKENKSAQDLSSHQEASTTAMENENVSATDS